MVTSSQVIDLEEGNLSFSLKGYWLKDKGRLKKEKRESATSS
jgi:hypothetical protein